MNTAQRLLDIVYNESGERYEAVVRRCLFCIFHTRDVNFDNEDFQQAVFDDVVTPLATDYKIFRGDMDN